MWCYMWCLFCLCLIRLPPLFSLTSFLLFSFIISPSTFYSTSFFPFVLFFLLHSPFTLNLYLSWLPLFSALPCHLSLFISFLPLYSPLLSTLLVLLFLSLFYIFPSFYIFLHHFFSLCLSIDSCFWTTFIFHVFFSTFFFFHPPLTYFLLCTPHCSGVCVFRWWGLCRRQHHVWRRLRDSLHLQPGFVSQQPSGAPVALPLYQLLLLHILLSLSITNSFLLLHFFLPGSSVQALQPGSSQPRVSVRLRPHLACARAS